MPSHGRCSHTADAKFVRQDNRLDNLLSRRTNLTELFAIFIKILGQILNKFMRRIYVSSESSPHLAHDRSRDQVYIFSINVYFYLEILDFVAILNRFHLPFEPYWTSDFKLWFPDSILHLVKISPFKLMWYVGLKRSLHLINSSGSSHILLKYFYAFRLKSLIFWTR